MSEQLPSIYCYTTGFGWPARSLHWFEEYPEHATHHLSKHFELSILPLSSLCSQARRNRSMNNTRLLGDDSRSPKIERKSTSQQPDSLDGFP